MRGGDNPPLRSLGHVSCQLGGTMYKSLGRLSLILLIIAILFLVNGGWVIFIVLLTMCFCIEIYRFKKSPITSSTVVVQNKHKYSLQYYHYGLYKVTFMFSNKKTRALSVEEDDYHSIEVGDVVSIKYNPDDNVISLRKVQKTSFTQSQTPKAKPAVKTK